MKYKALLCPEFRAILMSHYYSLAGDFLYVLLWNGGPRRPNFWLLITRAGH